MKQYVVVAGSGISVAPPSNLPSWWQYNQELIQAIKEQALTLCPEAVEILNLIDIEKNMPVQSISDIIVNQGAGSAYFPLLELLNSANPNANHLALAELAKKGLLKAVVTTNFDTLIETAFQQEAVSLSVAYDEDSFEQIREVVSCKLLKIHGSVTDSDSMIDTVTQKAVGLSPAKRLAMQGVFCDSEILVLGFSGADLDFDLDYLPFADAFRTNSKIRWVVRPGANVNPNIKRMTELYPDKIKVLEQELSCCFQELGVDYGLIEDSLKLDGKSDHTTQVWETMRKRMKELFSGLAIGPHGCVGYCLSLLDWIGEYSAAEQLANIYESKIEPNKINIFSVSGLMDLALRKNRGRDYPAARRWLSVAICCLRRMMEIDSEVVAKTVETDAVSVQRLHSELAGNLASCYTNMGLISLEEEKTDDAINWFTAAKVFAEQSNDVRAQSVVAFDLANAQFQKDHDDDHYLSALQSSEKLARRSGNLKTLSEVLMTDCQLRLSLGEYCIAEEKIRDMEAQIKNVGSFDLQMSLFLLKAELYVRRGDTDQSVFWMSKAIDTVVRKDARDWAAHLTGKILELYNDEERMLVMLYRLCRVTGVDELTAKQWYQNAMDEPTDNDSLPRIIHENLPEDLYRAGIILYEYKQNRAEIPKLFEKICIEYTKKENWSRVLDSARCLYAAANTDAEKSTAYYYLGCAEIERGNYSEAERCMNSVIGLSERAVPHFLGWSYIELANLSILRGNEKEAKNYYYSAKEVLRKNKAINTLIEACMAHIIKLSEFRYWTLAEEYFCELKKQAPNDDWSDKLQSTWSAMRKSMELDEKIKFAEEKDLDEIPPETIATEALRIHRDKRQTERAWKLIRAAKKEYKKENNKIGVGKCENNMGQFCFEEGNAAEAIPYFERALQIKRDTKDIGGESWTLSILIQACIQSGDNRRSENYVKYAEEHLMDFESVREKNLLYYSLFRYYFEKKGNVALALQYAKLALPGFEFVLDHQEYSRAKEYLGQFVQSVEKFYRQTRDVKQDEFNSRLGEAVRLSNAGKQTESDAAFQQLEEETKHDSFKLGQIHGSVGDARLLAGRYQEAIDSYQKALNFFSQTDVEEIKKESAEGFRLSAINGICIALDRSGKPTESIDLLKQTLSKEDLTSRKMAPLIISYCNRLIHNILEIRTNDQTYREILDYLNVVNEDDNHGFEFRGILYHTYGLLYYVVKNKKMAINYFYKAKTEFIKCNSAHLSETEIMLVQAEAL